jgi:hypothetical protein
MPLHLLPEPRPPRAVVSEVFVTGSTISTASAPSGLAYSLPVFGANAMPIHVLPRCPKPPRLTVFVVFVAATGWVDHNDGIVPHSTPRLINTTNH